MAGAGDAFLDGDVELLQELVAQGGFNVIWGIGETQFVPDETVEVVC